MMFKFFLLCVVLALGYSKSIDPRPRVDFPLGPTKIILQAIDTCLSKYNMDPIVVDEIRNGEYRDDLDFQNFIHCAYKNSGFAAEDGRVLVVEGAKIFPAQFNIGPVLNKCDSLSKGETPAAVTYSFFKCYQETSPVLMALLPIKE